MPTTRKESALQAASISELVLELFQNESFSKEIRLLAKTIAHEVADAAFSKLSQIVEQNEGRLHDLEVKLEEKSRRVEDLEKVIEQKEDRITKLERASNDLQQYSRRSSVRIFGVAEKSKENTDQIACDIAQEHLGIQLLPDDIDRSHRVGKRSGKNPRAIIVKFCSYRKRTEVMKARKSLKNTGITIQEDLTQQNVQLYTRTYKHPKVTAAWTHDGRIIASLQTSDGKSTSKVIHSDGDLRAL